MDGLQLINRAMKEKAPIWLNPTSFNSSRDIKCGPSPCTTTVKTAVLVPTYSFELQQDFYVLFFAYEKIEVSQSSLVVVVMDCVYRRRKKSPCLLMDDNDDDGGDGISEIRIQVIPSDFTSQGGRTVVGDRSYHHWVSCYHRHRPSSPLRAERL